MAKPMTVAKTMALALEHDWAVTVYRAGTRFGVRVWDRDRVRHVDGVHGTFACALREAIRLAFAAQDRQDQERDRPRDMGAAPQPGPALPTPELLATVLGTVCEVVA